MTNNDIQNIERENFRKEYKVECQYFPKEKIFTYEIYKNTSSQNIPNWEKVKVVTDLNEVVDFLEKIEKEKKNS